MQKVFQPRAFEKRSALVRAKTRMVHYTTAENGLSIVRKREFWLRKTSCMADYSEVEHGLNCLVAAYRGATGEALKKILNGMFDGFSNRFEPLFNGWIPSIKSNSYIACLSEHRDDEDLYGRLSMWRAFGNATGVAIVMNNTAFLIPAGEKMGVWSSHVEYLDAKKFDRQFAAVVEAIHKDADFLKAYGPDQMNGWLFSIFRSAALCTKHPGFGEEVEWRVVHSPEFESTERAKLAVETIRGIPQMVCKFPLEDAPNDSIVGLEPNDLIERIVIGPTPYGSAVADAFEHEMETVGIKDARKRIFISDIPLRG